MKYQCGDCGRYYDDIDDAGDCCPTPVYECPDDEFRECPACEGLEMTDDPRFENCPMCEGNGWVHVDDLPVSGGDPS